MPIIYVTLFFLKIILFLTGNSSGISFRRRSFFSPKEPDSLSVLPKIIAKQIDRRPVAPIYTPENIDKLNRDSILLDIGVIVMWGVIGAIFGTIISFFLGFGLYGSGSSAVAAVDTFSAGIAVTVVLTSIPVIIKCYDIYKKFRRMLNRSNPKSIDTELYNYLQSLDISRIEAVKFCESTGRMYAIQLDSIKRIALYISKKYNKSYFNPRDLRHELEHFMDHYPTSLPQETYKFLLATLANWVEFGGSFKIIEKSESASIG